MHSTPLIINAAVPSVNDALSQARGFGRLSGDPVVVVPQSLDDAIWRIGGCVAVGLKLVQAAETLEAMLRAVKILLEAVGGNWRNCEAMEQRNGFAVLAEVLRQKIGFALGGMVMRNPSSLDVTPDELEVFIRQLLRQNHSLSIHLPTVCFSLTLKFGEEQHLWKPRRFTTRNLCTLQRAASTIITTRSASREYVR
jgi:hypothetical protein